MINYQHYHIKMRLAIFTVLLATIIGSYATNISWNQIYGGSFNEPSNWTPSSIPGSVDTTQFESNQTYTVYFPTSVSNENLEVTAGVVTLDLGGNTYTLLANDSDRGVNIHDAVLIVTNGTLMSTVKRIGIQPSSAIGTYARLMLTNDVQMVVEGLEIGISKDTDGTLILSGTNVTMTSTTNWRGNLGHNGGNATIIVENGAQFAMGATAIAFHVDSETVLIVRGAESLMEFTGSAQFARTGTASAIVEDGGTLLISSTTIGWGTNPGDNTASVKVTGDESVFRYTGESLDVGKDAYRATLTVENGGLIECTHANSILTLLAPNAALRGAGGTIMVNKRVSNAGLVAPGNADEDTGVITIEGDYIQTETGAMRIKITANGQHDSLNVDGDVDLDGTLKIALLGDPMAVGSFDVLVVSGLITGSINLIADDNVHPEGLPVGYNMSYTVKQYEGKSILQVDVNGPPKGTLILMR